MPIPFFDPLNPPPVKACPRCRTRVFLTRHDLSCHCHHQYPSYRIAVGWICEDCDLVIDLVGLFTSWPDATSSFQQELRRRCSGGLSSSS